MNNFKYAFYYTTRNILWQYVYVFLYAFALALLLLVAFLICDLIYGGKEINELASLVLPILLGVGLMASGFFAQKKALQKVFFKPYKRFMLIPKVERITTKMVWFFILLSIPGLLIGFSVSALMKPYFNVGNEFNAELIKYCVLSILYNTPFSYTYVLFINYYFVRKYATVTHKYATITDQTKDDETIPNDGV